MRSGHDDGPEVAEARDWRCAVCGEAANRIIGVAALSDGELRFWVEGFCDAHEQQVRSSVEAHAREDRPPEIMVRQLLHPREVTAWMRRVRREAGVR
jgi:hypothetical protein